MKITQKTVDLGCQACGKPFATHVYDARTTQGPWAYLCTTCFKAFGLGLGVGRGQKYDTVTLEKVEG